MTELMKAWPKIKKRILKYPAKCLFLDFDGTLVRIANTPDRVVLSDKTLQILTLLSRRRDYHLIVISGRSIFDLKKYIPFKKNLLFSGNHGFELNGSHTVLPSRAHRAKKHHFLLQILLQKLRFSFSHIPGVLVEDKGYTASIHFRNISPQTLPLFSELITFYRAKYRKHPLLWRLGKKVWEIRPNAHWDKGNTALYIMKHHPGALPIVIGDDSTDEDMFHALKNTGITIRVGYSKKSAAAYYLESQTEVIKFLEKLYAIA